MTTRSVELLRVAHTRPGVTRAEAARLLGIGTGAATELVARLAQAALLAEAPAAPSGTRGRPTTALVPHPAGPLVLATAITYQGWRIDVVELGGTVVTTVGDRHAGTAWPRVVAALTAATSELQIPYAGRLRAMGVSVPGPVSRDLRLSAAGLNWHDVDLTELWPHTDAFTAGNDASLAAAAESARGAATDASVALHLRIEAGLGGAVVDNGRLLVGARGAGGEFGHMPFGDPGLACACGARGCWGNEVDGTALARLLGDAPPADPLAYARRVLASPAPSERAAVRAVAARLGSGVAGLVNALDPDLITVAGTGADLLAAAPEALTTAYRAGLMAFRRTTPPPIVPAALADDGPLVGAGEVAWSQLLSTLA